MSATLCWLVEMDLPAAKRGWHHVCELGDSGWSAIVRDDNSTPAAFQIAARKGVRETNPEAPIAYSSLEVAQKEALDLALRQVQKQAK